MMNKITKLYAAGCKTHTLKAEDQKLQIQMEVRRENADIDSSLELEIQALNSLRDLALELEKQKPDSDDNAQRQSDIESEIQKINSINSALESDIESKKQKLNGESALGKHLALEFDKWELNRKKTALAKADRELNHKKTALAEEKQALILELSRKKIALAENTLELHNLISQLQDKLQEEQQEQKHTWHNPLLECCQCVVRALNDFKTIEDSTQSNYCIIEYDNQDSLIPTPDDQLDSMTIV